ncbi:MAG: hypothetical protein JW994_00175 [Candidatus Omnitrophica bacterium]|nr:hypothetical protein [Candidatus Omnitrophota bacterium]
MKKISLCILLLGALLVSAASGQYRFYDGSDWNSIDTLPYSSEIKTTIKTLILRAAEDASFFSNSPILAKDQKFTPEYVDSVNDFYSKADNKKIPVYFALKIASMDKANVLKKQIQLYRLAVLKKINAL